AGGRGRRRGGAGVGAGAAPDQGSPQDLTAQFVEAAERAMGQIDRRSDELRLLLARTEKQLAAIRGSTPAAFGADLLRVRPDLFRLDPDRATSVDLRTDPESNLKNRFAVVYGLADQGLGVDEIAAKVKMTKGEVTLIMGLRKAR
ncbi:MAG: hypothetical protein ACYC9Q_11120, partial [Bacillota bacterium]